MLAVAVLLALAPGWARAQAFQPFWVQSYVRDVPLWTSGDPAALFLGTRPQWSYFYVIGQTGARYFVMDATTLNYAYVDATGVGPVTPPPAVAARVLSAAPAPVPTAAPPPAAAAPTAPTPTAPSRSGEAAVAAAARYYQALNAHDWGGAYALLSKYYRSIRSLDSVSSQNAPLTGIRLVGTRVAYADGVKAFLETSLVRTQVVDQSTVSAMRWVFEDGRWALDGEGTDLFFTSGNWDPNNPVSAIYTYYLMIEARYYDQAYDTMLSPAFHTHTPRGDIAYQFNGSGAFTVRSLNLVDMGTIQGRVTINWPDTFRQYQATWHLAPYPQGIQIDAIDWNELH